MRCHTPPREGPKYLRPSSAQLPQEIFFQCARDLAWKSANRNELCSTFSYHSYMQSDSSFVIFQLMDAESLFNRGHFAHVGAMCERVFQSIHILVANPSLVSSVDFLMAQQLLSRGLLEQIGRYLEDWSTTMGSQNTPQQLLHLLNDYFQANNLDAYLGLIAEYIGNFVFSNEQ